MPTLSNFRAEMELLDSLKVEPPSRRGPYSSRSRELKWRTIEQRAPSSQEFTFGDSSIQLPAAQEFLFGRCAPGVLLLRVAVNIVLMIATAMCNLLLALRRGRDKRFLFVRRWAHPRGIIAVVSESLCWSFCGGV